VIGSAEKVGSIRSGYNTLCISLHAIQHLQHKAAPGGEQYLSGHAGQ